MDKEIKVRGKLGKQQNFTESSQSCILNRSESTATQTLDDRPVITWDQAVRWEKKAKNGVKHRSKKKSARKRWTGRRKGQRHPFPSLDYRSPRFARRYFFPFSVNAEPCPRLE